MAVRTAREASNEATFATLAADRAALPSPNTSSRANAVSTMALSDAAST